VEKLNVRYRSLEQQDLNSCNDDKEFILDVLNGLTQDPKMLPCKYFYDEEGERLFRRITELPEYYLTNCEHEILEKYKSEIANVLEIDRFNLVELGAGDGSKAKILLEHFIENDLSVKYIPIDICQSAIENLIQELSDCTLDFTIDGLIGEYFKGLKWLSSNGKVPNVVLFLGSNIGNFTMLETKLFLQKLWDGLSSGDYLLIGFDLKKDVELLNKAYNDSENVTAEFNLNLLRRINRELGADFDLDLFEYYGNYDASTGAIESYLVSKADQDVYIDSLNQTFSFNKYEAIHTESSHKYLESDILKLATEMGYEIIQNFSDSKDYFLDSLWRVIKDE
jgi:dimethylhistidine N-methyltransferase